MFMLNEHTLEHLVCCQCKKYLSVKPVKVYPNRGIKCGRCSDDNDVGVVSCFGILADHSLFPCINRFDGCGQLLKYSEVAHHEERCLPKEYECPICVSTFKSSSYHIYRHFKELHPEAFLLNNPEFIIDIDQELYNRYLYCKNNLLFFIVVQYNHAEQLLKFSTLFLGDDCDTIMQSFTLYSLDRKMKHSSRNKPCYSAMSGGDFEWFQVNLEEKDFDKSIVICRFNLDTEQVEGLQRLPESVKSFSSMFQFPPVKNLTFNAPKQISGTINNWGISKESTKQTQLDLDSLARLLHGNDKSGPISTTNTTSTYSFSNFNKSLIFGSVSPKVAVTTSTTTAPSLVNCEDPFRPVPFSVDLSYSNVASNASSVIPCVTTPTSSNGGLFGCTDEVTASSSNRSLFGAVVPSKSPFGSSW